MLFCPRCWWHGCLWNEVGHRRAQFQGVSCTKGLELRGPAAVVWGGRPEGPVSDWTLCCWSPVGSVPAHSFLSYFCSFKNLLYQVEILLRAEPVFVYHCILNTWGFKIDICWMTKWFHNLWPVGLAISWQSNISLWLEEIEPGWMCFIKRGAWTRSAFLSWSLWKSLQGMRYTSQSEPQFLHL